MEVGAGMEVHQQLAGDQHPGLSDGAVIVEAAEGVDGPAECRDHLAQSLFGALGDPFHTGSEHPVGLSRHRLIGPDLPGEVLQNVQHGEGPRRQQHRPGPQHGNARMDALGVAGVCGEDGHGLKARTVQGLAENGRIVCHPAVTAELGHAHGHGALGVAALLQGVDQFADDHLAGEADVVVGVLLPHPDLLRSPYRQSLGPDAFPVQQGREERGHRG